MQLNIIRRGEEGREGGWVLFLTGGRRNEVWMRGDRREWLLSFKLHSGFGCWSGSVFGCRSGSGSGCRSGSGYGSCCWSFCCCCWRMCSTIFCVSEHLTAPWGVHWEEGGWLVGECQLGHGKGRGRGGKATVGAVGGGAVAGEQGRRFLFCMIW